MRNRRSRCFKIKLFNRKGCEGIRKVRKGKQNCYNRKCSSAP